jgi:hypothetical protein
VRSSLALLLLVACSSNPPSGTTSCDAGTLCGGACSTLQLDDANCGACGHACAMTESCAGGACYPRACGTMTCSGAQVCIGSVCVDRSCFGVVCPDNQACAGGACEPKSCANMTCAPDQVCVDNACVEAACVGVLCPAGLRCSAGVCVTDTCRDGMKDGTESDGDCGGICPPCPDTKHCATAADCLSHVCTAGTCVAPTCSDGVRNGIEAGIDCGGTCNKCPAGSTCSVGGDCLSGVCTGGLCAQPSCTDKVLNGAESDVDCGGGTCPACANGQTCGASSDCTSTLCSIGHCIGPQCQDQMLDNGESDVDCGGPCNGCATGKNCDGGSDCASKVCDAMMKKCLAPTCMDLVKNGTETDQDCGGGTCPACTPGRNCLLNTDCVSKVCAADICRPAACDDRVLNGSETDVDCGGAGSCPRCGAGGVCLMSTDCLSMRCDAGHCEQLPLFGTPALFATTSGAYDLALADLDGDNKLDVIITTPGTYDVNVGFGVGDGTFTAIPSIAVSGNGSGPSGVVVLDVTGDGKKDIVVGRCVNGVGGWGGGRVTIIRNFGARTFVAPVDEDFYTGAWAGGGAGVAIGDFNGDGHLDFAIGDTDFDNYDSHPDGRGGYYWLGLPDGGLQPQTELFGLGTAMASGDFNGDGLMDFVGHSQNRGNANVYLGSSQADAGAVRAMNPVGVSAGIGSIITGQLNNDTNLDFAVSANATGLVSVVLGLGDGTFLSPATYPVAAPFGLAFTDVNGDGLKDLVVGSSGIAVLPGVDGGTFGLAAYSQSAALGAVGRIAVGDLNGDNKPDVVGVAGGKVWVLLNVAP